MQRLLDLVNENTKVAVLVAVPAALAAAGLVRRWLQNRNLPPGPRGVPLLGCLRLRDQTRWHVTLPEVGQEYDGIFSFYVGAQLMIAVTSYSLTRQMLEDGVFAGRDPEFRKFMNDCGIGLIEGDAWALHRRLSLRNLRDFGFARPQTVEMLHVAMQTVFDDFDAACESQQPVQAVNTVLAVANSVVAQLVFGTLFTRNDPKFAKFSDTVHEMFGQPQVAGFLEFPVLRILDKVVPITQKLQALFQSLFAYIREVAREREGVAEPSCLCDVYIQERRKAERSGDFETFKEDQLVSLCFEFFAAGTDTTSRTVEWLLLFVAFNAEVQERVQQELDEVVGQRTPQLADRTKLHYVSAVMDESYRMAPALPSGVLHRAVEDTTFRGYRIPKYALIAPSVQACHLDPEYWSEPHQFRPERFLDDGGHYRSSQRLIPFLVGKRACPGESLARMEVFLVFTMLMQRYRVRPSEETVREEALDGHVGMVREPGKYALVFGRR